MNEKVQIKKTNSLIFSFNFMRIDHKQPIKLVVAQLLSSSVSNNLSLSSTTMAYMSQRTLFAKPSSSPSGFQIVLFFQYCLL
jgi:hypothetical protein